MNNESKKRFTSKQEFARLRANLLEAREQAYNAQALADALARAADVAGLYLDRVKDTDVRESKAAISKLETA